MSIDVPPVGWSGADQSIIVQAAARFGTHGGGTLQKCAFIY